MLHARFSEAYNHFSLIETGDHLLPVVSSKDMINKDGDPTTLFMFDTVTKPSITHWRVLFCPCVVQKSYSTCWEKGIKYASPSEKGILTVSLLEFHSIKKGILST